MDVVRASHVESDWTSLLSQRLALKRLRISEQTSIREVFMILT